MAVIRVWCVLIGWLVAGCVGTNTIRCDDGRVCPAGSVCGTPQQGCLLSGQIETCTGQPDGTPCQYIGVPAGRCAAEVCFPAACGDGVVDPAEVCDDGNTAAGDSCSADCFSTEVCGNGIVDVARSESCDDGNDVDGDGCQAGCVLPRCGDGVRDTGEACDDGNRDPGDGCAANCGSDETCGNGIVDLATLEKCDDGNGAGGDGCRDCKLEVCGNGILDPGETCDPETAPNNISGDGCSADCLSTEICGNGYVDTATGEGCDDGPGGACPDSCEPPLCGNGAVDPDEACDDENKIDGDGCNRSCTSDETCPNGVIDDVTGETCDDGNAIPGDGCSACRVEVCGNGTQEGLEACDDDNTMSGDGCSGDCLSDETCGNGYLDAVNAEQCDDGGTSAGGGCGPTCKIEACGNGVLDPDEVCDPLPGNTVSGDGCSADCLSLETCRNGIVDVLAGEECDDNNATDLDGCHNDCTRPRCGDGKHDSQFGEGCDLGSTSSNNPDAACRPDCQPRRCGDGIVDPIAGEMCDDANASLDDGCRPDCLSDELCRNGVVDAHLGETCDDGNALGHDGCASQCALEEPVWTDLEDDLFAARHRHAVAYDTVRKRLVLFGGTSSRIAAFNTTHERTSTLLWIDRRPSVSPAGRRGHAMAFDVARARTVMFGGELASGGELADTWTWDGAAWTVHTPATFPGARMNHAVTYDSIRNRVVLFGGVSGGASGTQLADTWEWDGTSWIQRTPATSPPAREQHAMAFDPIRNRVVLYGGFAGGSYLKDTWEYDGTTWTNVTPAADMAARAGHAMAFHGGRGRVVLYAGWAGGSIAFGSAIEWTGTAWQSLASTTAQNRKEHAMAYDADRDVVVSIGGQSGFFSLFSDTASVYELAANNTWSGGDASRPDAVSGHAAAFHALRGTLVVNGGINPDSDPQADTWEFDGVQWVARPGSPSPARTRHRMAYDAARDVIVMFGGRDGALTRLAETWEWNGATWTNKTPALASNSPSPRSDLAMAYDARRGRVVVFGGRSDTTVLSDSTTWEWTGTVWLPFTASAPPPRYNAELAYDAVRQRLVLFGGVGSAGTDLGDTWERDGTTWTNVTPLGGPLPNDLHALAYDPARRRVVLYGGPSQDTWEWDGVAWRELEPSVAPTVEVGNEGKPNLVYDPVRRRFTLLRSTFYIDLWTYRFEADRPVDSCDVASDADADTELACDDPDCWGRCTPLCPPATSCSSTSQCGDLVCNTNLEDCALCPGDCGACP